MDTPQTPEATLAEPAFGCLATPQITQSISKPSASSAGQPCSIGCSGCSIASAASNTSFFVLPQKRTHGTTPERRQEWPSLLLLRETPTVTCLGKCYCGGAGSLSSSSTLSIEKSLAFRGTQSRVVIAVLSCDMRSLSVCRGMHTAVLSWSQRRQIFQEVNACICM